MPFSIRPFRRIFVQCAVTNNSGICFKRPLFDPNRSITEFKSGRSTASRCGREALRSLECNGRVIEPSAPVSAQE